jgi:hypothetical protein
MSDLVPGTANNVYILIKYAENKWYIYRSLLKFNGKIYLSI